MIPSFEIFVELARHGAPSVLGAHFASPGNRSRRPFENVIAAGIVPRPKPRVKGTDSIHG